LYAFFVRWKRLFGKTYVGDFFLVLAVEHLEQHIGWGLRLDGDTSQEPLLMNVLDQLFRASFLV